MSGVDIVRRHPRPAPSDRRPGDAIGGWGPSGSA